MEPSLEFDVSEASHSAKTESVRLTSWADPRIRLREVTRCLLLIGCAYLAMDRSSAFCSDQDSSPSAAQRSTERLTKRRITVADSIGMTRLGDQAYADGGSSRGIAAKFSPDGRHFVVILKKGNLETNTNEYSLVLFQTAEVFQSPVPRVLVSLTSSSNRPAINNVLWLDDNDTILFLGEHPGEQTQVYSLKCSTNELKKLTSSATALTLLATSADGEEIVYTAKDPASTSLAESATQKGIVVTNELVTELVRGSYGGKEYNDALFIQRSRQGGTVRVAIKGTLGLRDTKISVSPDGAHLLLQTEPAQVDPTWTEYEDPYLKLLAHRPAPKGGHTSIQQYELVDTLTGTSQVLIGTPIPDDRITEVAWSPDSKSVIVSDVYLPLNVEDPVERSLRKTHFFMVEFKIPSRTFVKISQADLKIINWDRSTGVLTCDVGELDSLTGKTTPKAYFRKDGETWSKVSAPEQTAALPLPDIFLDEGMNTPPHLVAVDRPTGRKSLLMDLNPQFQNLASARVEEITWRDARGIDRKGGLYWPPDYVVGKKYPLVIQTHEWDPDRFWMDGPFTTAFCAQALASNGFFVVQLPDPDDKVKVTRDEAPAAMAVYESAIAYLDRRGLIDRNRVGITGFSRTDWYVAYMLTHSKHQRFAAAALADGVDFSYFQYMLFPDVALEFEPVYGGPPYGKSMSRWLKESPAFLMDKIETPLRIQTLGPGSVLGDWHWYTGLFLLGKPVEMVYIPDGTHILEKPWERLISQQGNLEWFCFWLKGEEDPDPAKAEQYQRWRELRTLQEKVSGQPKKSGKTEIH
jgi:hypothetical protein